MVDLDRFTIERAAKGDEKAFRKLYDHYAPFVWRIAFRTAGGDRETAGEIVQDTFIRVHGAIKKFASVSALGTWIYRIAFNAANTCLAKRSRYRQNHGSLGEDFPDSGAKADAFETDDLVRKILSALTPEDRFLLVAREIDGLSFEELAEITGISSGALRTRLSRLRDTVRSQTSSEQVHKEVSA